VKRISVCAMLLISSFIVSVVSYAESSAFLEHSASWEDDSNGCELEGKTYPIGEMIAMNRNEIEAHEKQGGYVHDAEAIMMKCTYLVDPMASDHPAVGKRDYRWVAFSWAL